MDRVRALLEPLELDRTTLPELVRDVLSFEPSPDAVRPRRYPGYPRVDLPRPGARWPAARRLRSARGPLPPLRPPRRRHSDRCNIGWPGSLDRALAGRRSRREVSPELPPARALARLLRFGHGALEPDGRGPAPSAGGLQAVELYVVTLAAGWLPRGAYHYDRPGHHLSRVAPEADPGEWRRRVPSLEDVPGAPLVLVLAGDAARVASKYGDRAAKLLLLEAGHVMQDLCLVSASAGLSVVPCGAFLEEEIARALALPRTDAVLYAAACGAVR